MARAPHSTLLYLDFDGVVCDSERECFVSSWLAYRELTAEAAACVSLHARRRFREMRPLIRSGEDYVVIQEIVTREAAQQGFLGPTTQRSFDAYRDALGSPRIARYKDAMAATRNRFLERDRTGWLALNRLYPHMHRLLTTCDLANVRILSTKTTPLVCEILRAHRIPLPATAVFHAASNPNGLDTRKLDVIGEHLDAEPGACALFVEDQLDHLLDNRDRRITTCLADWGYILPQWLQQMSRLHADKVQVLSAAQMPDLFQRAARCGN